MPCSFFRLIFSAFAILAGFQTAHAQWDSYDLPCRPNITNIQVWNSDLFATSGAGVVYRSTNGGANWNRLIDGLGLTINPKNGDLYTYINDVNGVSLFRRYNQGSNGAYYQVPFAFNYYYSRMNVWSDTLYFSNGPNLQFFTPQTGWVPVPTPADFYFHESIVQGGHIWADNYAYVIHSPDRGVTWDTVAYGLNNNIGLGSAGDTILIACYDSVQQANVFRRTSDGGKTWVTTPNLLNITGLTGGRPFFGKDQSGQSAWYSWNGLTDWQKIVSDFVPNGIAFSGGATLLAQLGGIEIEKNGQRTWGDFGKGIPGEMAGQVFLRTADDWMLFGGQNGQGLFKRKLNNSDWTQNVDLYFADQTVKIGNHLIGSGRFGIYRAALGGPDFQWTLVSPKTGLLYESAGKLYLANPTDGKLYRSNDLGQTWNQTGAAPGNDLILSFALDDGRFYYRQGNAILVSEDEGANWTTRYTFAPPISLSGNSRLFALDGQVFLSYLPEKKIFKSSDNGFTFNVLSGNPQVPGGGFFRLRVYGGQLFLFIREDILYRSADFGQTWLTVKPPYEGFNFEPGIGNNAMTVDGGKIYLFDPVFGVAWVADLAQTAPSPCDNVYVNFPEFSCYDIEVDVAAPTGFQHTWLRDSMVIYQGNNLVNSYPEYPFLNGSTYTLTVYDPVSGCSVSDETTINRPIADIGYSPVLPCTEEFAVLDLSGSSQGPGYTYQIYGYDGFQNYQYVNVFDAAGNPSNSTPPKVRPGGTYVFSVSNNVGCYAADTAYIKHEIPYPIAALNTTPTGCGLNNGTATVQIATDPGKTQIGWSTGAGGTSIGGLAPGWYSVTVTEDYCRESQNFEIIEDTACLVRIRGSVWNGTNCTPAYYAQSVLLHLTPDDLYTFTNKFGAYEFARKPGSHTVEFVDPVRFDLLCPSSGSIPLNLPAFGSVSAGNDFFVTAKPVKNLTIAVSTNGAVPGFPQKFSAWVCNHGDQLVSDVEVVFLHDPALGSPSSNYNFNYDAATHAMTWLLTLYPGQCTQLEFTLGVPASTPLGSLLHFSADVLPDAGDFTPADNHQTWATTVQSSFDPNDKQVSPGDTEYGGRIFEQDSVLRYTIRFQNTGNHPATTVEIRDTLDDATLDVRSILLGATSHPYYLDLRFEGRNILIFRFDNINLPDSMASQEMSQGFVGFSIKRKPGLPIGTVIRNRAGIYFDFNAPVITNWAESVLSAPVGTSSAPDQTPEINIFPNPNTGVFTVELPAEASAGALLRIIGLTGCVMSETRIESGSRRLALDAGFLPAGLYTVQAISEGRVWAVEKFVKQ